MPKFFTKYDADHPRGDFSSDMPSMTEQHHKQRCDLEYIVSRLSAGIPVEQLGIAEHPVFYDDVSRLQRTREELENLVASVRSNFESLPSELRIRFENSPEKYFDFVTDPNNRDEAIKMGVIRMNEADKARFHKMEMEKNAAAAQQAAAAVKKDGEPAGDVK